MKVPRQSLQIVWNHQTHHQMTLDNPGEHHEPVEKIVFGEAGIDPNHYRRWCIEFEAFVSAETEQG